MKELKVFLGGGVALLHGSDDKSDSYNKGYKPEVVAPVVADLNARDHKRYNITVKDFADLARHVVKGGQQEASYNRYIRHSDVAMFIADGDVGPYTIGEIDVAVTASNRSLFQKPRVYIYGRNIPDDSPLLKYLNDEKYKIYYVKFEDKRQLSEKIKFDLIDCEANSAKQHRIKRLLNLSFLFLAIIGLSIFSFNRQSSKDSDVNCTAQLYLMRYKDVDVMTDGMAFDKGLLQSFQYEDSVVGEADRLVFPLFSASDSAISTVPPYFRLKLHNKQRNTLVLVEATLEIEEFSRDSTYSKQPFIVIGNKADEVDDIYVDEKTNEAILKGFRQSVAYGEVDDRYFFTVHSPLNCSYRMRARIKTHNGDYIYSNYVYLKYVAL